MQHLRLTWLAATTAAALIAIAPDGRIAPASAQQHPQGNQQWFVPGQGGGGRPQRGPAAQPQRPAAAPAPVLTPPQPGPELENEPPPTQVQLPPIPEIPAIAKGTAPPTAVIGVFGFRDVLRASTAVQQLERVLGERRDKLNQDVQKEQAAWRELQQELANKRASLSPEQIRTKERELQERVTRAQRQFRDRTRILQESYQYGAAQVERVTGQILKQVAESRGMNLVLPREQVPLSNAEFDITEAVVEQLNKVMTTVVIPPEGVPLAKFAPAAPTQVSPAAGTGGPLTGPAPLTAPATPAPPPAPAPR